MFMKIYVYFSHETFSNLSVYANKSYDCNKTFYIIEC